MPTALPTQGISKTHRFEFGPELRSALGKVIMKDYSNEFHAKLDVVCTNEEGKPLPEVSATQFYSALARLIVEEIELDPESEETQKLLEILSAIPSSPSAAKQSLVKYRNPNTSKPGKKVTL